MEKLSFFINNQMVYVSFVRTTNRNMYLKVKKDNTLEVSAPNRVPQEEVVKFVEANLKRFVKYINKTKERALFSFDEKFVYIKGNKMPLEFFIGVLKPECRISGKTFYLLTKEGTFEETEKALMDYVKKNLLEYISIRQKQIEIMMNVPNHEVKVTHKNTTWGTNNIRTKSISYSSKLYHFKEEIIDYVIIHELSHYYVHDHSEKFWKVVAKFCPNYEALRKELRTNESVAEE